MLRIVKNNCSLLLFAALMAIGPFTAFGQQPVQAEATATNYSQQELETFVEATQAVQAVQQKHQKDMVAAIQEEGLTPAEFQQMAQSQQKAKQGQQAEMADVTKEKKEAFSEAMAGVMEVQKTMQAEMASALTEHDMEMQDYQLMVMNIRQSPELSQKVTKMLKQ